MPHKTYAIYVDDKLARFQVTAVITRRETAHGNPHDYKSAVEGRVPNGEGLGLSKTITVGPDRVLGPFEEYEQLVAQREAEKQAQHLKEEAKKKASEDLWSMLYAKTGVAPPNDPKEYRQPFRAQFNKIEISEDGVKLLTEYLRQH
jgi:hypothetical protein